MLVAEVQAANVGPVLGDAGQRLNRNDPAAAVELAWDRDNDVVYVIRAWREKHTTPVLHAAALRSWGKRLIWTWPRDGRRETLEGAGISLAKQYTAAGLTMTRHACQHR